MSFLYEDDGRYFAQIADGLEELGAVELAELGAADIRSVYRGLHFGADRATLYRINYASRLVSHVLAPVAAFGCHDTDYLYSQASRIDWNQFLDVKETFAINANVSNSSIGHSKYAALRLKDAVVDQFRESFGRRPSIDTTSPDLLINLHISGNQATIAIDCSGASLHKRGYRSRTVQAPMQEILAAAVIRLSEWDGERPLRDPMCGSGTLLCEALLSYCRIPSAWRRKRFGFQCLPDYDYPLWKQVRADLDAQRREMPEGLIAGGDLSKEAAAAARANLALLPGGERVHIQAGDFRGQGLRESVIVCNPPYGIRLSPGEDLGDFYRDLGDWLKNDCTGSSAFVFFGDRKYLKNIGLRPAFRRPLGAGGLDARLARFDMY